LPARDARFAPTAPGESGAHFSMTNPMPRFFVSGEVMNRRMARMRSAIASLS
jgi:hypothetical protein